MQSDCQTHSHAERLSNTPTCQAIVKCTPIPSDFQIRPHAKRSSSAPPCGAIVKYTPMQSEYQIHPDAKQLANTASCGAIVEYTPREAIVECTMVQGDCQVRPNKDCQIHPIRNDCQMHPKIVKFSQMQSDRRTCPHRHPYVRVTLYTGTDV